MDARTARETWAMDRELVLTRVFDAPRDLVFKAWTEKEHVSSWFGPRGFTTTTHEMEFREGGMWRFDMRGPDGKVYMSTGGRSQNDVANVAQDPMSLRGKILRLNDDGTVPADNPFVGRAGYRPEIYTLGHRNTFGLIVHPVTRQIWQHENGPQGGDLKDVRQLDTLIASADPVAADAYATTLFDLKPDAIASTVAAHTMGLGEMALDRIRVVTA